jgi:bifunctional non-homologous end joining protein LigD
LERKKLLEELLPSRGPVRFSPHFEERGEAVYAEVTKRGLEGIVAKQADSPYRSHRSRTWRKVRALQTDDFVVVGFTAPGGDRAAFGALHLAAWVGEDLVYAGRVGSGFAAEDLAELHGELAGIERAEPPCPVPASQRRGGRWVEPRLVCEVRYAEITAQGLLRQPVFLRRRDDKAARECRHPGRDAANTGGQEAHPESPEQERKVPFTNLSKVFWPAEGITKGDLLEYHRRIAPWILPYLRDRPLVLTRYPDGIEGKSFFQKDAPRWVPSWVRTERMWSEQAQRDINYFVCDELDQLLYVVNLGAIPLHVWSSRVTTLQRPDWCILDLDPKEASFRDVIRVARALHALCRQVDLPCFVKTSGASGLHLLLPLGRLLTYEQSRALAGILARIVVDGLPEIATLSRSLRARRGRVYVDTLHRFTLRNASTRMRRLKQDPLLPVLEAAPDLLGALELLKHGTTPPAERRRTP